MSLCIWYVSKYAPASGRAGTRGFQIMRELARMGHRAVILTSDSNHLTVPPTFAGPHLVEVRDGVEVCWIRTLKYGATNSMRRILSWIDFEWRLWRLPKQPFGRPDAVVVSSLSLLTILNGLLMRRRYGCRLLFEIRDIWPLTMTEEGGFSRYNPFVIGLGLIERLGYARADVVVGLMPNLGEHVADVLGRPRETHCVPMGIDELLLADPEPLPVDYEATYIPKGKFLVGYAGSIGISNALDTLFACARAMKDVAQVHFLIVGDGDLKPKYQALCADLPNVTFAPPVRRGAVQSVLAHADLLYFSAHPSKVWRYGQSLNKVIDLMLAGKPIVASYSGFPSMIDEAGCGTFVPAGDVEALRNEIVRYADMAPAEREAMGAAGRTWLLRNRRYETLAENYLRLIAPDVDGPGGGALA